VPRPKEMPKLGYMSLPGINPSCSLFRKMKEKAAQNNFFQPKKVLLLSLHFSSV